MSTTGVSRVAGLCLIRSQTSYPLSFGINTSITHEVGLLGRDHRERLVAI